MRRALASGLVIVFAATTLGGCKKLLKPRKYDDTDGASFTSSPAEVNSSEPLLAHWKDTEVTFPGASGTGSFSYSGTKLTASFHNVVAGDTVEMGGDKATATSSLMMAQVDLGEKLAKLRPTDAFDYKFRFNPEVKVNLVLGHRPITIDAPATSVSYGLTSAFKKAADTPITLPLPPKPPAEHTILFTDGISGGEPIGPAQTVDAIDWVAISTKLPDRQGKMCTGFKKTGETGPGESLPLVMHDQKMTVYDVRTCKEIANKTFKAPESCPSITFSKEASSYPSKDDMKAWLRTLRTKT